MVHTVIFDLDGTLYDYDKAHTEGFDALSRYAQDALDIQPLPFRVLHRDAMLEQERRVGFPCGAVHSRIIRYQIILEQMRKPISHAPKMVSVYWDAFLHTAVPYPGAETCLRSLRSAGYRVGVGTNMTADYQFAKLERLGLLDYIDFMLSSEETGIEKPDPRFFAWCVEKAGCPASECVFVGDNPVLDVAGAVRAGIRAVWFRPEQDADCGDAADSGNAAGDGNMDTPESGDALPPTSLFYVQQETPPEAEEALRISRLVQLPDLLAGL